MTEEKTEKKAGDPRLCILILQIVTAAVLVAAAFVVKLIGGDLYAQARAAYYSAMNDTTTVTEVTDEPGETVSSELAAASEPADPAPESKQTADPLAKQVSYYLDPEAVQTAGQNAATDTNSLIWPLVGEITSPYGYRVDPITGVYSMHGGIDIAADSGTRISSAAAGTVAAAGENASYGKYVMIQHNANLATLYAHCSAIDVAEGQEVKQGQQIARVGSTGMSTGPHLHFEIRIGGRRINPRWLLLDMAQ